MKEQQEKILIRRRLQEHLGRALNIPADQVTPDRSFFEFGISSQQAVRLAGKIESEYALEIEATIAYEYPTVEDLAAELARRLANRES